MTTKSSRLFSIAITLAALSAAPCLMGQGTMGDDSRPPAARLTFLEGPVQVDNQDVTSEIALAEGDVLATGDNGVAEVELASVGMLRLAPDTQVTLSQLASLTRGQALTQLDFDSGEMELEILGRQPGEVAVSAHNKNIRITRNGRFRFFSASAYPLELAVWAGEATVYDPQSGRDVAVAVERGETFVLAANDPEKYDLEKGIEADDLDQFSQMRDQSLATEAENVVPGPTPDSGPDFVDPCQPPYPYVVPPDCFNFAAFYAIPIYAYPFATGVGSYHRHPKHLPFLRPPAPPVTATAKPPASAERVAGPVRRPRIDLNDENFKRSVPERSQTEANNKPVAEAGAEPNTENPSTKNDARRLRVIGNSFTESREVRASRPAESAHTQSAHSAQESSTYSHASAGTSTHSYSAPHSSGGGSASVASHSTTVASSTASSSSSSSSGHGK